MAALTRSAPSAQERLSHEMGMHTEQLGGRSREAFFDIDLGGAPNGFLLPNAYNVDYNKRAEIALEGFAKFAAQEPRARFIWVGERSPEYDVRPREKIIFTGRVAAKDLTNYLALTDVAINLRFPTSGEASGAVMRLLAYGKPSWVSNVGWFAELPREAVVHVDVGNNENASEVERVAIELTRLAHDPAHYSRISDAAREYAAARTPTHAAQAYLQFARTVMKEYVRAA